jgi:hypothetical protein
VNHRLHQISVICPICGLTLFRLSRLKLTSPFWSECEPPSESQVARLTEAGSGHSTLGTRARRQRTMTN